jgi:hypothetical protein
MPPAVVYDPISFGIPARRDECRQGSRVVCPNEEYSGNNMNRVGRRHHAVNK